MAPQLEQGVPTEPLNMQKQPLQCTPLNAGSCQGHFALTQLEGLGPARPDIFTAVVVGHAGSGSNNTVQNK